MFADYVYEKSGAKYTDKILLIDVDQLIKKTRLMERFKSNGFEIVEYRDDLNFRIEYEEKVKSKQSRIAVVSRPEQYIPYDLRCRLTAYEVSLVDLFPRLNTTTLKEQNLEAYDIISSAYEKSFDHYQSSAATEQFLRLQVLQIQ